MTAFSDCYRGRPAVAKSTSSPRVNMDRADARQIDMLHG